jgi:hypothetical protein
MRRLIVPLCSLLLVFGSTAPAGAITFGGPDGTRHAEVGAVLSPQAFSDGTWAACSGVLISSTVFLTAAHCDQGVRRVAVTFDSTYASATGSIRWGSWHANPDYNQSQSDPADLAVIVLDEPVIGVPPARLPSAGSLDSLRSGQHLTSVGYGVQTITREAGGLLFHHQDTRFVASGRLDALTPTWLRVSQNPATGNGGTCYGDSGGPNFLGAGRSETDIIAAITITGDNVCRATNVDYRLDTQAARAFLGQYVTLP